LGNDLNDVSMFSNALDDNDFIVIAANERTNITNGIIEFLKSDCNIKGIDWESVKLLVLEERSVNKFLKQVVRVLKNVRDASKRKEPDIRKKYKVENVKSIGKEDTKGQTNKRAVLKNHIR
jgi:hypothetical protein